MKKAILSLIQFPRGIVEKWKLIQSGNHRRLKLEIALRLAPRNERLKRCFQNDGGYSMRCHYF